MILSIFLFAVTEEGTHKLSALTLKGESGKLPDSIVCISYISKLHNFALANLCFGM